MNLKIILTRLLLLNFLLIFNIGIGAKENANVLLLSSYHPGFPSFFNQINGLKTVFDKENINLDVEFMDSKRFMTKENLENFYNYLKFKLKKGPHYHSIVISDDNALNFAIKYQNELFKDLPIVFFGVNNSKLAYGQNKNKFITGVAEEASMQETIDVMLKMFPNSDKLYFIVDDTETGKGNRDIFYSIANFIKNKDIIEINLKNLSFEQYAKELNKIEKKNPVLLLNSYSDKNQKTINFDELIYLINNNLKAPLFHLWYHGIGKGVIGGKLISHFEQGKMVANTVLEILNGKDIASIKVSSEGNNLYVFDYNILTKFDVDFRTLPQGSKIVNLPQTFYAKYKSRIHTTVLVFVILITLTIILGINVLKRKRAEKNLVIAKEKAENKDKLKTNFIHKLSHEVRTPLNGIVGFSELLENETLSKETKESYLTIIKDSGAKLLNIINDIIEVSEINKSKYKKKVQEEDTNINHIISDIFFKLEPIAKSKKIEFIVEKKFSNNQCIVKTNAENVKKSLQCLLDNAIKYTEKGFVKVSYEIEGNKLVFIVKDTGIGISEEIQEVIFEQFIQAEQTDEENKGGLGLGLTIARKNAKDIGGNICLDSKPNIGTTAYFTIPYKPIKIKEEEVLTTEHMLKKTTPYSILVAEDDEVNYIFLESLLKKFDSSYKIIRAKNGEESVDICKSNKEIDLVLMDIEMPIMTGIEATRIIKEIRSDIPIIAQTAYITKENREKAFLAGCSDFISKPIKQYVLKEVISKYIEVKN
jgi:signal transduction histidine kinase/ActR/RegA family two-component response regulator